jgi:hypothetical protein
MDVAMLGRTTIIRKTRESMRLLINLFKICASAYRIFLLTINYVPLDHGSFWGFTKIIKNKFRGIPALKLDGLTLITESEKTNAITSKCSLAHENSMQSDLWLTFASSHTAKSIEKAERAFRILYSFLNRKSKLCLYCYFTNPAFDPFDPLWCRNMA